MLRCCETWGLGKASVRQFALQSHRSALSRNSVTVPSNLAGVATKARLSRCGAACGFGQLHCNICECSNRGRFALSPRQLISLLNRTSALVHKPVCPQTICFLEGTCNTARIVRCKFFSAGDHFLTSEIADLKHYVSENSHGCFDQSTRW